MRQGRAPLLAAALLAAAILPALPAVAAEDAGPSVAITLAASTGTARPGEDLQVTGTVTNLGTEPLQAGTLVVGITPDGEDRGELEKALADPSSVDSDTVATAPVPPLSAGAGTPVSVTIPAADLDRVLADADWGVHVLTGELEVGDEGLGRTSSGVVWADGSGPAQVGVTTVMPFTTPGVSVGLLDAESLEAYTSAGGVLRKKLDAVLGTPTAIALDPRIIASIRALGTTAPADAVTWMNDLRAADNAVFPLSYADADLSLERAAGAPSVLAPGTFESSLDPANFTGATPEQPAPTSTPSAPTPSDSPQPTPTPTPSATPGALPTGDALLAWNYTSTDIAWSPRVLPGDLPFFAASGLTRALVPSNSLADAPSPLPASATVEGSSALVIDSLVSDAVSTAAFSASDADSRKAFADASALLAATAEDADEGQKVVIALDRAWPASTATTKSALDAVRTLPWTTPVPLSAEPEAGRELAVRGDQPADPRVPAAAQLIQDDAAIAQFASAIPRPELLTGRERLPLLAVLSAEWLDLPDAWQTAAADLNTRFQAVLSSVSLTSTNVLVVSPDADVPIFVRNDLDYPVTLTLVGRPSNGRILVENTTATIDAESSQRVSLPARTIVNGQVNLTVTAYSPSQVPIGNTAVIALDVQAEWEAVGTGVVIGLVVLLFGFGIYRNIRRRRRAAAAVTVSESGE